MPSPSSVATVPRVPAPGGSQGITHRLADVAKTSRWVPAAACVLAAAIHQQAAQRLAGAVSASGSPSH